MSVGYIYVLSNETMPGLFKIGFTNGDVRKRVMQLSSATGVPKPFEIEYYCLTSDVENIEATIHRQFSNCRKKGKEFFQIDLSDVVIFIDSIIRTVQPDRFCKVQIRIDKIRPATQRDERPFDPEVLRKWQEKHYRSNKP